MNEKDSGWDLTDLEREIEGAVDKLFVEKKRQAGPVVQPKEVHPSPTAPPIKEGRVLSPELRDKLEEVEAQLLTLEWDISSKHINKAINLIQDLRKLPYGGDEFKAVAILIQKVLYQLLLDESKLTPHALKFLQKSWKVVKGMTDERFSFEIDKKTLVRELTVEFQRLKIEEEVPKERIVTRRPPEEERISIEEKIVTKRPLKEARISFEEIKRLMDRIQKLEAVLDNERKRWENIHKEIISYKADLQRILKAEELRKEPEEEEIVELDERLERGSYQPSDFAPQQPLRVPTMAISLFEASEALFGLPDDHIVRSFPVKKWVADFFIESGKVKLKDREISLLNPFQVFRLKPSTEENPLVLLVKGRDDNPAAVIVDQAISRE
ncbi:MAG: hypothetical protein JRI46_11850 [Deltaproteobacteria bacterium]|nr:hypothetical protein [Deltaproteobacteria bacterium]